VEGRVQGDPRPLRRPAVRLIVAATLAASAVVGAVVVLPHVERDISRDSKLTAAERRHAAGDRLHLDSEPFDAFRARLAPGVRYAVDVPPGKRGPFITRGAVVRAYAAFYFLPAIEVRQAPLVFRYRFR
jgi:hypothetical protein